MLTSDVIIAASFVLHMNVEKVQKYLMFNVRIGAFTPKLHYMKESRKIIVIRF